MPTESIWSWWMEWHEFFTNENNQSENWSIAAAATATAEASASVVATLTYIIYYIIGFAPMRMYANWSVALFNVGVYADWYVQHSSNGRHSEYIVQQHSICFRSFPECIASMIEHMRGGGKQQNSETYKCSTINWKRGKQLKSNAFKQSVK